MLHGPTLRKGLSARQSEDNRNESQELENNGH
jgi:hypothetical protein